MYQEFLNRLEKFLTEAEIETKRGSVYWHIERFLKGKPVKKDLYYFYNPHLIIDIPIYKSPTAQVKDLVGFSSEYQKILNEMGYSSITKILTLQEHELAGGTDPELESLPHISPYIPVGILRGELNIDEAQRARELRRCAKALGEYYHRKVDVLISLEPLDENGKTIRNPIPLNRKTLQPFKRYRESDDFPYRRGYR